MSYADDEGDDSIGFFLIIALGAMLGLFVLCLHMYDAASGLIRASDAIVHIAHTIDNMDVRQATQVVSIKRSGDYTIKVGNPVTLPTLGGTAREDQKIIRAFDKAADDQFQKDLDRAAYTEYIPSP